MSDAGLWLTPEELLELTGWTFRAKQKAALARMGVPFRSRDSDGFPLVERQLFAGAPRGVAPRAPRTPRLGGVDV